MPALLLYALLAGLGASPSARAAELTASVTDEGGKPVADAVVFVYDLKGKFAPPGEPAVMDQVDRELMPHVLPVLVGSKVRFPNKDNIHHHLYSFSPAKTFELPLYKGEPADPVLFDKPGVVKLGCNIHDWMSGIILVLPNPYFALTGPDGTAVLKDLPKSTELEVAVFHERQRGSVDDTKKPIHFETKNAGRLSFKLSLKADHAKKRPPSDYK